MNCHPALFKGLAIHSRKTGSRFARPLKEWTRWSPPFGTYKENIHIYLISFSGTLGGLLNPLWISIDSFVPLIKTITVGNCSFPLMRYAALCHSDHVRDSDLGFDALYATHRDCKSSLTVRIGYRDFRHKTHIPICCDAPQNTTMPNLDNKALQLHSKLIIPSTHCILLH